MSGAEKTFRLGGAGGYSIRAIGHAPARVGGKPSYTSVQFWKDDAPIALHAVNLVGVTPPMFKAMMQKIDEAGALGGEDKIHLWSLVMEAWRRRTMQ